jgi:hypothetical protein
METFPVLSTVPVTEDAPFLKRAKEFPKDDMVTIQVWPGKVVMVKSRRCPVGITILSQ